jgi:hypothetical protein
MITVDGLNAFDAEVSWANITTAMELEGKLDS